ncbi:hypothetical protein KR222_005409, partial [Zaprionus bogoriensis]
KMSARCRACGKIIYCLTASCLFEQPDSVMLHQIEALTGIFLPDLPEFPAHICGPCEVALREAIVFRERIIRTQQLLLGRRSVAEALQQIDLDEAEQLQPAEKREQRQQESQQQPAELSSSQDNITVYEYAEDEYEYEMLEQSNQLPAEPAKEDSEPLQTTVTTTYEPVPEPPPAADDDDACAKPAGNIYAPVNFAIDARSTPRVNWSSLTEEEIVALKRERRKRDCICEQCGRHFSCPSNFKVHLLRHTGVKNFACKQCPMRFYTPHLLRRHEFAHLCEKPYRCQYCEQTFADHSGRIQHERNRHTNYKPYKCSKCDKAFAVSNKLKTHMLSHSGVRSFHCEVCKVSFMRRPHLAAHYRSKGHEQNAQNLAAEAAPVDIDIES